MPELDAMPLAAPRRQLRLALSMNGGVSLAVWIGGAVAEVDRIRRGDDPFWTELLSACGYFEQAQVDVMAGASAGGLNAVMMAQAIHGNVPFAGFASLWREAADITRLVREPRRALDTTVGDDGLRRNGPRAVLDGEYFLDTLLDALDHAAQSAAAPPAQDLAVLVSATLVRSNPVAFRDVPGDPITDSRGDAYFHVAKRGADGVGLDGFAGPDGRANRMVLARVGRATSSLPGLFEPCQFDATEFGSALVGAFRADRHSVEVMDGGVVDNVPIARAIRAVYNSPATTAVRRVLLYMHPDPGDPHQPPDAAAAPEPEDPDTVVKVVTSFSGKRAESIREDIEVLREHNDNVERRRALAKALLAQPADAAIARAATGDVAAVKRAADRAALLRAAMDPAAELGWHAPHVPRLAPLIDAPGDPSKDELSADLDAALAQMPNVLFAAEHRRAVAALRWTIFLAQQDGLQADVSATLSKLDTLATLTDLVHSYQLARMLGHGAGGAAATTPGTRLIAAHHDLASLRVSADLGVAPPSGALDDNVAATWRALASWTLPAADGGSTSSASTTPAGGTGLDAVVTTRLAEAVALLPSLVAPTESADGTVPVDSAARAALAGLSAGVPSALDDTVAKLLQLLSEPVASDQRIDFVRVAGNVHTPASNEFLNSPRARHTGGRIAGQQLHHLGAFFEADWRDNDWRWGRLDAVPALLDAVLDDRAIASLRARVPMAAPTSMVATVMTGDPPPDEIRQRLLGIRQAQIVAAELGLADASPSTVYGSESFATWRAKDRRLASLLGSRHVLSAGVRAAMTASRVVAHRASRGVWAAVQLLRPVVLALVGFLLAGRWAAPATAWSVCVLGALRTEGQTARWWVFGLGAAAVVVTAMAVERWLRPTRPWYRVWLPYGLAVAGLAAGAVACAHRDRLRTATVPIVHWSAWWAVPGVASAIAALALFFWMRWYACALMMVLVGALYGGIAYLAARHESNGWHWGPVGSWPLTRSMWTAFVLAVLIMPLVAMRFPQRWLTPGSDDRRR